MIREAQARDAEAVRVLLREYAAELGIDLSFQGFDDEVADPLGFYEVVLVDDDGGCVALRRIDDSTCEMKRLFVRPSARGSARRDPRSPTPCSRRARPRCRPTRRSTRTATAPPSRCSTR